jgi:hypothetical protein
MIFEASRYLARRSYARRRMGVRVAVELYDASGTDANS